jgi:hypothetical protein
MLRILGRPPGLDQATLFGDQQRLTTWYVAQGFPLADVRTTILPADVWWVGAKDARWAEVLHQVEAGPRVRWASVTLEGASALPEPVRAALLEALPALGDWTGEQVSLSSALARILDAQGHPGAVRVDTQWTDAGGALTVTVETSAEEARIGRVVVSGLGRLRGRALRKRVEQQLQPGEPWSPAPTEAMLRAWSTLPGGQEGALVGRLQADGTVDAEVQVRETARVVRRPEAGVGATGSLFSAAYGSRWTFRGLGGRHLDAYVGLRAGWRIFDVPAGGWIPDLQTGPEAAARVGMEGLVSLPARMTAFAEGTARLDAWRGNTQVQTIGVAGLRFRPYPHLELDLGWQSAWSHHLPFPTQDEAFDQAFGDPGLGLLRTAGVHGPVLRLRYDTRDRSWLSQRGVLAVADLRPWGAVAARQTSWGFSRVYVDVSAFQPVVPRRLVLVGRVAGGIHPYDDTAGNGLLFNRFFLGGAYVMRGFGFRRLNPVGASSGGAGVHLGGDALLFASGEARLRAHPDADLALFGDVGRVWESVADRELSGQIVQRGVHLEDLQPTAGVGAIVRTPIGFLGTYLGFRLLAETGATEPPPPIVVTFQFLGLGEKTKPPPTTVGPPPPEPG